MAVPTLASVTPQHGHSGGTLVQIVGTNFRQIPDPDDSVPANGISTSRVEVEFSNGVQTEVSESVAVWSETELYCTTPRIDPFDYDATWTASANTSVFTSTAHKLLDGVLLQLSGSLPIPLASGVPYYTVNTTADTFQVAASIGGAAITLTADGDGSLACDGGYDVTIRNLDDADVPIDGEEATLANAFRPMRPNLAAKNHLADVFEAWETELRRQVVRYVTPVVHSQYNEETGTVEYAMPARLPALIIGGVDVVDADELGPTYVEEENYNDPETLGDYVAYRPAQLVNIVGQLVGVSDNKREILGLLTTTKLFFRKNTKLWVVRDASAPGEGKIGYPIRRGNPSPVDFGSNDGSDVYTFTVEFEIRSVRLEDIPGMRREAVPGVPTDGRPYEAIIERGKSADVIELSGDGVELSVVSFETIVSDD